jgi:hypothetical protein
VRELEGQSRELNRLSLPETASACGREITRPTRVYFRMGAARTAAQELGLLVLRHADDFSARAAALRAQLRGALGREFQRSVCIPHDVSCSHVACHEKPRPDNRLGVSFLAATTRPARMVEDVPNRHSMYEIWGRMHRTEIYRRYGRQEQRAAIGAGKRGRMDRGSMQ